MDSGPPRGGARILTRSIPLALWSRDNKQVGTQEVVSATS